MDKFNGISLAIEILFHQTFWHSTSLRMNYYKNNYANVVKKRCTLNILKF